MHATPFRSAATLLVISAASAQGTMPLCNTETNGQVMCRFGTVYECRYIDPNSLSREWGWRWTADILRDCQTAPPPAPAPSLPPGFVYAPQWSGAPR